MASVTFNPSAGGDGSTVDDSAGPNGLANGGFRTRLVPAFTNIVNTGQMAVDKAAEASSSASAAAVSAASAAMTPATNASSTTSLAVGTGSKSLTIETGKNFVIGMNLIIASTATPANTMYGQVISYTAGSGALVVNVTQVTGSGTISAWTVSLSGPSLPTVINELKGSNIASASTINLDTASGNFIHVTGATTITAITLASGAERTVVFDGVLTLTHNAITLILPGGMDIITTAGDSMDVRGDGSGNARVVRYTKSAVVPGVGQVKKSIRSVNTILGVQDRGYFIDITSGTFTQTFATAATLGDGWYCWVRNSGTGDITIPSSDGFTNWIMFPNEARLFQCDGTVLTTLLLNKFTRTFPSSATFIRPPGYDHFDVELWAGGGGGGGGSVSSGAFGKSGGGAGGGGGYCRRNFTASEIGTSISVTIAAIATGGASGATGSAGNSSSIGTLLVATGGGGGQVGTRGVGGSVVSSTSDPYVGGDGGSSSQAINGSPGVTKPLAGVGGGAGAGENQSNVLLTPGGGAIRGITSLTTAGTSSPASPTAGADGAAFQGGGGGGSAQTANGAAGGSGGIASGGGGGGSARIGFLAGAGGNGGPGYAIISGV